MTCKPCSSLMVALGVVGVVEVMEEEEVVVREEVTEEAVVVVEKVAVTKVIGVV